MEGQKGGFETKKFGNPNFYRIFWSTSQNEGSGVPRESGSKKDLFQSR